MGIFTRLKQFIEEAIHKLIPYKQIEQAGHFESPVSDKMTSALNLWAQMFVGEAPWLSENDGVKNNNIAADVCSELARQVLNEMKWNITGTEKDADGKAITNPRADFMSEQFKNCTGIKLRENVEKGMAAGGLIIKPCPMNGKFYFDFSPDWCVYPIAFDGDYRLIDVYFRDQYIDGKTIYTRLERHTVEGDNVKITQRCFESQVPDNLGKECSLKSVPVWSKLEPEIIIEGAGGKPLFGWYRVAKANTTDLDTVLGSSVFANAVTQIKDADTQYSRIMWEFEAKETAIDVDPSALVPKSERDTRGIRYEMPKLNRRLFRAVDLGNESTYNVFDPPIRDVSLINGLNSILCRIEDLCGIARGTLSDPNEQAMTATQIIMLKQRTYDTIRSNQQSLEQCLRDVIDAMEIYANALEMAPKGEFEVSFEWDDSVIVDTTQELNERITLKNAGAMSAVELRMWYFGETEAQATESIKKIEQEKMQSMMTPEDLAR